MSPHDELDLLSSYVDEELDAPERARLEAHMTTCDECRTTLAALTATVADLKTLPEPAPSPQDSWALRAAIRRARSPMRKWQRLGWAAGAVAAAAIAFVAITLPGDDGERRFEATSAAGASEVPIFQSGENLRAVDAQARLLALAGITAERSDSTALDNFAGGPTPSPTTNATVLEAAPATGFATYAASQDERAAIERCVQVARDSTQEFLEAVRYEIASFESKPAYFLYFRTGGRYELWVVARPSCDVLYFGQAGDA